MNAVFNFIIEHWAEIICVFAMVCVIIVTFKDFFSLSKAEQIKQIKGWLLGAVTLAEAEFGSGTGKIKLSVVYDSFIEKFPWIAKVLTFEKFSGYVDEALVEMRKLLSTNEAVAAIVEAKNEDTIVIETEAKVDTDEEG